MIENEISCFIIQAGGQSGGFILWLPLVFIFGVFYFLLIMPQQKRQKRWQQMVNDLKNGDKIITGGGIRGTIARRWTLSRSTSTSAVRTT